MKLLREVAEERSRSAFLGYGSEEKNFAIKLDYSMLTNHLTFFLV